MQVFKLRPMLHMACARLTVPVLLELFVKQNFTYNTYKTQQIALCSIKFVVQLHKLLCY